MGKKAWSAIQKQETHLLYESPLYNCLVTIYWALEARHPPLLNILSMFYCMVLLISATFLSDSAKWHMVLPLGLPQGLRRKNSPATQEMWAWSPGWEDPLGKKIATHSSILAWEIPWTEEEPGRLQSMGLQRVGHNWVTDTYLPTSLLTPPIFLHPQN